MPDLKLIYKMELPDVADKLLKYLVNNPSGLRTPDRIGADISEATPTINVVLIAIKKEKPDFLVFKPISANRYTFGINPAYKDTVVQFLKDDGFSGLAKTIAFQKQKSEHRELLELENLQTLTDQAKQAMKDSKYAKRISLWSTIIAVLSLIVSGITLFATLA